MGEFKITLYDDGIFWYNEGPASSYIGVGTWRQDGDVITLTDDTTKGYGFVNQFNLDDHTLTFIEKDSSNFLYVEVADGDRFELVEKAFKSDNSIWNQVNAK